MFNSSSVVLRLDKPACKWIFSIKTAISTVGYVGCIGSKHTNI